MWEKHLSSCEHSIPGPAFGMASTPFLGVTAPSQTSIIQRSYPPVLRSCPKGGCMIQAAPTRNLLFDFTDIGRTTFLFSFGVVAKLWKHMNGNVCIRTFLCPSAMEEKKPIGMESFGGFFWAPGSVPLEPFHCKPQPFSVRGINAFVLLA